MGKNEFYGSILMIFLKLILMVISISCFYFTVKSIFTREINSAVLFYPVFFLIFPMHLYLDVLFGIPNYDLKYQDFVSSYNDLDSNYIYLSMIIALSLIINFLQIYLPKYKLSESVNESKKWNFLISLVILLPIVALINAPNPLVYMYYGDIRKYIGSEIYIYHGYIASLTLLSSFLIVWFRYKHKNCFSRSKYIFFVVILIVDVYLNSKRAIMFVFLAFFWVDYFYSRTGFYIRALKILLAISIFIVSYSSYTNYVKYDDNRVIDNYMQYRIEFGRDDVLKYVIYKTLVSDDDILEYSGQSIYGTLVSYVPRTMLNSKPYPYAQYLTNSLIWGKLGPALQGWTMTTSLVDELVSNFKYFSFVIIPFVYWLSLKYANRFLHDSSALLFFAIFVLWHFVHATTFALLIYIFLLSLMYRKVKRLILII